MPNGDGEEMEEEQAERALLEEFVEPLLCDVRRTIADTFVVEWFVAEEMWWWSCRGTSATLCERGDVRASVSGSHRWELLADLSETIADNAFDEGPVWPLCPTHKNHSLNAKARGNSVKWVCTTDGVADHWTLGSLPKEGVV